MAWPAGIDVDLANLGSAVVARGGGGPPGPCLILFVVVIAIVGLISAIAGTRPWERLEGWARENGHQILKRESRSFFRGPFFWNSGKGHTVYRIVAKTGDGRVRDGWARVGSGFLWWPGRVDVRWDPPPPPPREEPPGFPVIMPGDRGRVDRAGPPGADGPAPSGGP